MKVERSKFSSKRSPRGPYQRAPRLTAEERAYVERAATFAGPHRPRAKLGIYAEPRAFLRTPNSALRTPSP